MFIFRYEDNEIFSHHSLDKHPNPSAFHVHTHNLLEIYYMIRGKGSFVVEGSEYTIRPGSLMLFRVAEAHQILIDPSEPYERIVIDFAPSIFRNGEFPDLFFRPFNDRPLGKLNHYDANNFATPVWANAFQDYNFTDSPSPRANIIGRLMYLMPELVEAFEHRVGHVDSYYNLNSQIVDYVNTHLFESISIEQLSNVFYVSESTIKRVFTKATVMPLGRYITLKRVLGAKELLRRGENPQKACKLSGFEDYSTFYRAYKRVFGCPPSDDVNNAEIEKGSTE